MKGYSVPPDPVKEVMNAVCLLFGKKEDWQTAKTFMGDLNFLNELIGFDVEKYPEKRFLKLRELYMSKKGFTIDEVKRVSGAATSIFTWVQAIDKFQKVNIFINRSHLFFI